MITPSAMAIAASTTNVERPEKINGTHLGNTICRVRYPALAPHGTYGVLTVNVHVFYSAVDALKSAESGPGLASCGQAKHLHLTSVLPCDDEFREGIGCGCPHLWRERR